MAKFVGVRLTKEEHEYLMKQPGKSEAAKLRSLLHQTSISDEIAEKVASRLESRFAERLKKIQAAVQDLAKK